MPLSPAKLSHSVNGTLASGLPVPMDFHDRSRSRADSIFNLYDQPEKSPSEIVIASGKLTGAGPNETTAPPPIAPGDRLEIDEMSDQSLIWQVVRDLRRNSTISLMSDFNGFSGFHSRNSSGDSAILPSAFGRSRLGSSGMGISPEKLKLVVTKNKHRRMLSAENGVGNLGYIRSPVLSSPVFDDDEEPVTRPSTSSDRSLQIYEADDNVVSALIEDVS
jgi:hypothetical protein